VAAPIDGTPLDADRTRRTHPPTVTRDPPADALPSGADPAIDTSPTVPAHLPLLEIRAW